MRSSYHIAGVLIKPSKSKLRHSEKQVCIIIEPHTEDHLRQTANFLDTKIQGFNTTLIDKHIVC